MKHSTRMPVGSPLTPRKAKFQYAFERSDKVKKPMAAKSHFRIFRTLTIDEDGNVTPHAAVTSYRAGFLALFDFKPLPVSIVSLAPGEPTRAGFARVGAGLRDGLARARARHAG